MRDMEIYRRCDRCGALTVTGTHVAGLWLCLDCTDEPEERPVVACVAEDGRAAWQCPDCGTARLADVADPFWRARPDVDVVYCEACGATFEVDLRAAKGL